MATHPGEKADRYLSGIWDKYYLLEGIDLKQDKIESNWEWLKTKKRG